MKTYVSSIYQESQEYLDWNSQWIDDVKKYVVLYWSKTDFLLFSFIYWNKNHYFIHIRNLILRNTFNIYLVYAGHLLKYTLSIALRHLYLVFFCSFTELMNYQLFKQYNKIKASFYMKYMMTANILSLQKFCSHMCFH